MKDEQAERLIQSIDALTSAVRALSLNPTHPTSGIEIAQPGPSSAASWESSAHSPSVQEMVDRYISERTSSGEWGDGHREAVTHWLGHMTTFLGPDKPIVMADRAELLRYRQHLVENPKRNGKERRAASTVNTILIHVGAFFRWCRDTAEVIEKDPTVKLRLKTAGRTREPFTDGEIEKVWTRLRADAPTPAHYWIPTICLLTGARREEVAQLKRSEVLVEDANGILFIDFAGAAQDERGLKTAASARRVPVHPHLRGLGLQALVNQETQGEFLFDAWCPLKANGLRAGAVGVWFNQRLRKLKVPKSKVLHSTRHTMATRLKQLGAEDYIIAQILGHENPNITTGHYGHEVDLEPLDTWIQQVGFPL